VAFVLRVTRGAGAGESLTFDEEARLGRTADNDVVIKDASSSRTHARVFMRAGRYYVEDLKSANGTLLNQAVLKTARPLEDGDEIAIGKVVVEFSVAGESVDASSTVDTSALAGRDDPGSTMVQPQRAGTRGPAPRRGAAPRAPAREPDDPDDAHDDEDEDESGGGNEDDEGRDEALESTRAPARALQRRSPAPTGVRAPVRSGPSVPARPRTATPEDTEQPEPTAADRARNRRELERSVAGRVQLLWSEWSMPVRALVSLVLAVLGLGLVGGLVYLAIPRSVQKKIEPTELRPNSEPIAESFGVGADVDFERSDMKSFSFIYNSPTRVVGVLHYHARTIEKDEVSIDLNGTEVGRVPADLLDTETRELDVVLPSAAVNVGEPNELVFDNVNNPPNEDPWRVWNIWVELIPIPEMNGEEAARRAQEDMDKAAKYYELRNVGAENLFRSWKTYRDAWLLLEATPERPEKLHQTARSRMREIRVELDRQCATMLVKYQKLVNARTPDPLQERTLLEDIPNYFPTREHPCHTRSRALLRNLEELQEAPEPD
jgi:pSer/pThr/pTyr-binding forkhead associated (FHA) protein